MHYLQAEDGKAVRIWLELFLMFLLFKKKQNNTASTFPNTFVNNKIAGVWIPFVECNLKKTIKLLDRGFHFKMRFVNIQLLECGLHVLNYNLKNKSAGMWIPFLKDRFKT